MQQPNKHFAIFATALGDCAIVWSQRGLMSLMLPERTRNALRGRIRERFDDALESTPDRKSLQIIRDVVALLEGRATDLSNIALDMQGLPPFHQRVYHTARAIGFGKTMSYGELATRLGCPNAARAVGQALGRNPFALIVPCHRVLAASGKLTGFSAYGGVLTKRRLLELERAGLIKPDSVDTLGDTPHRRITRKKRLTTESPNARA